MKKSILAAAVILPLAIAAGAVVARQPEPLPVQTAALTIDGEFEPVQPEPAAELPAEPEQPAIPAQEQSVEPERPAPEPAKPDWMLAMEAKGVPLDWIACVDRLVNHNYPPAMRERVYLHHRYGILSIIRRNLDHFCGGAPVCVPTTPCSATLEP